MDTDKRAVLHRPCPICGGTSAEIVHHQQLQQPDGSPLPREYDVVACGSCGFVYADTPASQAAYDRYYAEHSKYEDPLVATGGGASRFDRRRLNLLADRIAAQAASSARILDIGCASGGLLHELQRRGFESLHGVDTAPACVEQVRQLGIDATRAKLSSLPIADIGGPFDVIVLSHVLEHVVDLRSVMESLRGLLAPDGLVYAETPDASRYANFPFVPFYFFDSEHINHFDNIRLAALGAAWGFQTQATGTADFEVGPAVLYPACWIWLRRGVDNASPAMQTGRSLVAAVKYYVENCERAGSFPQLERLAKSGEPVIIWGAGSFAQRLFGGTALRGCKIVAVVDRDRNKQGLSFGGFIVQSPEAALAAQPDATIAIAAAIHGPAIAAELENAWPKAKAVLLIPSRQE